MRKCEHLIRPGLEQAFSDEIRITEDGNECRVTVPFQRADQDAITLWIRKRGDEYVITDEGETYGMLYLSNIDIRQDRRKKRVESTKKHFGLDEAEYEVKLTTNKEHLGERLLDAIQAIQSISYLTYTRRQYTHSDFRDDVGSYLSDHDYRYDPNVEIQGGTEKHRIDFHIRRPQPTYLEALHAESASSIHSMAQRTAYKWTDLELKNEDITRISVLDDESGQVDDRAVNILKNYSDAFVPWSKRDTLVDVLG